jgi:hypothetical protein
VSAGTAGEICWFLHELAKVVVVLRRGRRKVTVFSATLSAYSIEPGDEKPSGPDLLVGFHDNDHYNSVRDEKSPPKPPKKPNKVKIKEMDMDRQASPKGFSEASDSTTSTAAASVSDISPDNKLQPSDERPSISKTPVKKSAPCPCGSGERYKKCCSVNEKLASRLGRVKGNSAEPDVKEDEDEAIMNGNFRIFQI